MPGVPVQSGGNLFALRYGTFVSNTGNQKVNLIIWRTRRIQNDHENPVTDGILSDANVNYFEHTVSSITSTLLAKAVARDRQAWKRIVDIYGPLVYRWCRRARLSEDDASDISQQVFEAVSRHIDQFSQKEKDEGRNFIGWLRRITDNKINDEWRRRQKHPPAAGGNVAQMLLQNVPLDCEDNDDEELEDEIRELYARIVSYVRSQVTDAHWEAFWRVTVNEEAAADVAKDLQMSRDNVYTIKARILRMLRTEFGESV